MSDEDIHEDEYHPPPGIERRYWRTAMAKIKKAKKTVRAIRETSPLSPVPKKRVTGTAFRETTSFK